MRHDVSLIFDFNVVTGLKFYEMFVDKRFAENHRMTMDSFISLKRILDSKIAENTHARYKIW